MGLARYRFKARNARDLDELSPGLARMHTVRCQIFVEKLKSFIKPMQTSPMPLFIVYGLIYSRSTDKAN